MKVNSKKEAITVIKNNGESFNKLGVDRVGLFGSFVRNKQDKDSDIDLLVEFKKGMKSYQNFFATATLAEKILGRKVDIVTPQALNKHISPHINKEVEYVQIP